MKSTTKSGEGVQGLWARVRTLSLTRWEGSAYAAILLVAAIVRFWDLGSRALHHDESLHAYYSVLFANGGTFQHNPLMHGPFQFEAMAVIFKVFGDSDYTARLLPALVGTALVLTPLLLRRYLGRTGAVVTAALLAFSPSISYYSRFARNDIYVLLWDILLIFAVLRYMEGKKDRYLYLAASVVALGVATKEVFFITILVVGSFLAVIAAPSVLQWLRGRVPRTQIAAAGTMLVLLATLTLPQGAAALGLFQEQLGVILLNEDWQIGPMGTPLSQEPGIVEGFLRSLSSGRFPPPGYLTHSEAGELVLSGVTLQALDVAVLFTLLLIGVSTAAGLWWGGWRWAFAALVFWSVYLTLFTTFFTNAQGVGSGLWQSLGYWLAQQDVQRGGQPWYYYFVLLPVYEFLPLVFGVGVWGWHLFKARNLAVAQQVFGFFLLYWGILSFFFYGWAGEKMPWLSTHLAFPLILAAGFGLGKLIDAVPWRALDKDLLKVHWRPIVALSLAAVLFIFTVRAAFIVSFESKDVPRDALIYTQTSPAIPELRDRIAQWGEATGQGPAVPVLLDTADAFGWPWYWYLRDYTNVRYVDLNATTVEAEGRILVLRRGNEHNVRGIDETYGPPEPFPFRQWFPEDYKGLTTDKFLKGLSDPLARDTVWSYWLSRELPSNIGSTDAVAYFPKRSA